MKTATFALFFFQLQDMINYVLNELYLIFQNEIYKFIKIYLYDIRKVA